ncbi:hypothetical protein [Flavobacterium sp.]|uniref:hypothetical protein n=1 Tax=Flavobacterium sp. TaxID=239 RepID=UPI003A8E2A4A
MKEGRTLYKNEIDLIREIPIYPEKLVEILKKEPLICKHISLDESIDESGFGVEMQWMTVNEQLEEMNEFYPGIIVSKYGYLPVGKCLEGSGNPYFIKEIDNELCLFRILHDLDENEIDQGVEFICLLKKIVGI